MRPHAGARQGADTRRRGGIWVAAAVAAAVVASGCGSRIDEAQMAARLSAMGSATGAGAVGPSETMGGSEPSAVASGGTGDQLVGDTSGTAASGATAAGGTATAGTAGSGSPAPGARATSGRADGASAGSSSGAAAGKPGQSAAPAAANQARGPAPAAAAGSASAPAGAKAPVVLGHVGDYSGVIGAVLKGGNVMAQVVARAINDRGGLDGHPVQVVSADAGGDPSRALSLVRDMVENKGAVAFFGNIWPLSGNGPRDYLEQKKIPVIGGDSAASVWFQSPMYFPSAASWPNVALGAAKMLVDAGKKKIAVLYCVEAEPCRTWHDVAVAKAASVGGQIVYDGQVSLAQPDFTAECIQAQRNGAESVMAGVDGPSLVRMARACAQQGYRPQFATGSLAVIESIAKDPNLDGVMAPMGIFPYMADDLPGAKEYQQALARYAPSLASSPTTAGVWTAGTLLQEVAKAKLPDKVASSSFFPGLYAVKNNTLGGLVGPLTFTPDGPAASVRCVFAIKAVDGRFIAPDGSKQLCL